MELGQDDLLQIYYFMLLTRAMEDRTRTLFLQGRIVGGVYTGQGHEATTTWWLGPLFRQRYPNVLLDESNMIVKSGRFVTAGAALSHMDLALWLIRSVSPQLASLTAKYLIVDSRPSQSA